MIGWQELMIAFLIGVILGMIVMGIIRQPRYEA